MATDFRDGTRFPRRGREAIDGWLWFARLTDKARAARAGTLHDYLYPCPMDLGVLERWGVAADDFDVAVARCADDGSLLAWLRERVGDDRRETANAWVSGEKAASLDRQDREEGVRA